MASLVPEAEPQPTLAEAIAAGLHALEAERLPAEVVAKAKLCVLDFLACAFASRKLPWSRQAVAVACANSGVPASRTATIVGTAHVVTASDAAFANAVLGHALVRDDMHLGSVSHLGVAVLPALLALAETHSVTGKQLLAAIVAGYEAGGRLGRAILDVEVSRIFRPTGITGPFAAAAAGAKLLGLEPARFAVALELAANMAAGYNEWAATGGSEMFFHPGLAARNALTAVELAATGAYASPTALEGKAGLFAAFGKNQDRDRMSLPPGPDRDGMSLPPGPDHDGLPPRWERAEILDVFFKEVPACNFAQTAAQAARDIAVRDALDTAAIEHIVVRVPYAAANYPGCDCAGPFAHILQAKMSIHYNVAAALYAGNFNEANYEPSSQPEIRRVARLVVLEIDDALTHAFPAKQGAEVIVTLRGGRRLAAAKDSVSPASDAVVRERFLAAAEGSLGRRRAEELDGFVATLEDQSDAGALARLARASG
jgi:2-methylcitrate dehydratase PrpD